MKKIYAIAVCLLACISSAVAAVPTTIEELCGQYVWTGYDGYYDETITDTITISVDKATSVRVSGLDFYFGFDIYADVDMEAKTISFVNQVEGEDADYGTVTFFSTVFNGEESAWDWEGYENLYEADAIVGAIGDGEIVFDPALVFYNEAGNYCWLTVAKNHFAKLGRESSGVSTINSDKNAPVEFFNLQGVKISEPAKGQLVIRRQGGVATKTVVR